MIVYNKLLFYFLTTLCAFFSFAGIFTDKPYIVDHYDYYVIGRVIWGSVSVYMGVMAYFSKDIRKYVLLQLINMMAYSVHGQYFVSCYYLGFLQLTIINGVVYPIPRKQYQAITLIGAALLILVVLFSSSTYTTDPVILNKFKYDCIMSILIFTFASNVFHKYITVAREEKDKIALKFADIGKNASYILHDFKGLMVSPALYAELIKMELDGGSIDNAKKHSETLSSDLNFLQKYLKEINGLTAIESESSEILNINDIVNSLKIILKNKIGNIAFEILDDQTFYGQRNHYMKIIYNLVINSIESFGQNEGDSNNIIKIEIKKGSLIYKDNGNGFPEKILKDLNKKTVTYNTCKETGSGLGIAIVKEIVFSNHGDIKFYNDDFGAVVEINIKK